MSLLEGNAALVALADRLRSGTSCPILAEPPLERLRLALDDPTTSELDRALLVRHALRYASLRRGAEVEFVDSHLEPGIAEGVGLEFRPGAGGRSLAAAPWRPAWLPGTDHQPTDETAMRAERCRFFPGADVPGDSFLRKLGRNAYRSAGQRAAVRAALAMPQGAALIVDLPTGEGKSTVFAAIDQIGFAADPPGRMRGTTLVVVPTVTLALDHERSCGVHDARPLAYVGGRADRNDAIRAAIDGDVQGLCFAAPEAATGPLRQVLNRAAARGTLRAVVVDEAHLVEGWGTGFRTEFQTLAGVCRSWGRSCPTHARLRTVLLSATLTEAGERVLAELFAVDGRLEVVSAAQARPEIEYWAADPSSSDERDARVLEALLHLPRPAILYVTEVEAARNWFDRLRARGFGRLRLVHGGTPAEERERVLRLWAGGTLDLVVATSAFGLGVDYAHVRAVVHACVPESFDRFYQEAGRAGRDGCAATSIVLPTHRDFTVAEALARRAVISVERGLERWRAMFTHQSVLQHGHPRYGLRLDVAPGHSPEDIDLVGQRSVDWNARTLALMARSGLLHLAGVPDGPPGEGSEAGRVPRIDVEIVDEGHLDRSTWAAKVEPKRAETASASMSSLQLMRDFLRGGRCPGRLVSSLYATRTRRAAIACGGCALCRETPSARAPEGIVGERLPPWPVQGEAMAAALVDLLGTHRRLLVQYPGQPPSRRDIRDLEDAVKRLDAWGLRIFANIGAAPAWLASAAASAVAGRPWFTVEDHGFFPVRWPRGARLAACGTGMSVDSRMLSAGISDPGMILLVPEGAPDSTRPDRTLAEVAPCPVLTLEEFLMKVLR
jgi:ATP-dependent DNA helicase RecQ